MKILSNRQPLWLPKGSVRAAIALLLVLSCIGYPLTGVVVPSFLKNFTGVCIGYYFGSRGSNKE